MRIIADHFRRYAHALRFAIGLHGAEKFHPIVKNKHYQISRGARASLPCRYSIPLRDGMWNEGVLETVLRSLGPSKLDTVSFA